ncbi:hypothetical protein ACHAQA_005433 [Verticillium albo-atrum]
MDAVNGSHVALVYLHNAQLEMNEGDTAVYIDMPAVTHVEPINCLGLKWTSFQFKMHSENIRLIGSPKFNKKLKKLPAEPHIDAHGVSREERVGMKYMMDLTPSMEGDEAAYEMAEMSLTPGVIGWWRSQDTFEADPAVVGGHDDVCHCSRRAPHFEVLEDKFNFWSTAPAYREIPEYCPIRHRIGILRLLYMIEGKHVLLDSAPRVWTMMAISKIYGCTHLLIKPVEKWLLAFRNTTFLEVLPEEGLEIAKTFKFVDLTRFTFELLVYEKAMMDAGYGNAPHGTPNLTVLGRKRRNPGDDLDNMIQHAAQALVQRNTEMMRLLGSSTIFDDLESSQWRRLAEVRRRLVAEQDSKLCIQAVQALDNLKHRIFEHWRKQILHHALGDLSDYECCAADEFRLRYVAPQKHESLRIIYSRMNPVQKVLCIFFYNRMGAIARTGPWETALPMPDSLEAPSLTFVRQSIAILAGGLRQAYEEIIVKKPFVFMDFEPNPQTGLPPASPFHLAQFDIEVFSALSDLIRGPHQDFRFRNQRCQPDRILTNHLMSYLGPHELKFLPVWAGGQDDGTGRVLNDVLPPAEDGPDVRFGGGATLMSPSVASMSDLGGVQGLGMESHLASETTSMNLHMDGSTIYNPGHVIADGVSIHSEAFTETVDEFEAAQQGW